MHKLSIYDSSGDPVEGSTLTAGQTYYAPLTSKPFERSPFGSFEYKHDDAIIITSLTLERTNQPSLGVTADGWRQVSTGLLAVITIAGGSAGGDIKDIVENCAGRGRLKIVVGATGGAFDLWDHHKGEGV